MDSVKVLYISQEITPYLPETEISLISRKLPQAIQEKGKEIRAFMPRFGNVNERVALHSEYTTVGATGIDDTIGTFAET